MKTILIVIGVFVLAGIGAGTFIVLNKDEAARQADELVQGSQVFNAKPTADLAFKATMTGTSSEGEAYNATILSDGKGNSKYTTTVDGAELSSYILTDRFITCTSSGCFEFSDSQNNVPNITYEYSEADFDKFQENATYTGQESCNAGTCAVWQINQDDTNTKVYLASDGRVSNLEASNASGIFKLAYEYTDVTIDVPKNVQKLGL